MARVPKLTVAQQTEILAARERGEPIRAIARNAGVSASAVVRTLARARLRTKDEFKSSRAVTAPRRKTPGYAWDLELIRSARDDQMLGKFDLPVRLAEAMRTDDALFVAYHNRIAPQSAIQAVLTSCGGARGDAVHRKALASVIAPRSVLTGIHGTLANHGIAIGYVDREVTKDGTLVHMRLREWPLEHVRWNATTESLETRVLNGGAAEPIVHGDGTWIVFRKFRDLPWTQEACVLPGALIWASHANGVRDWAAGSFSHGNTKIIAELPTGIDLVDRGGNITPAAQSVIDMLQEVLSGDMGVGIRPPGSKTDVLANNSTAWQVFAELILNREKAAARVYLGTDAILGSQGGAPGVDIATLFGIASTKVQGDLWAIEDALRTGLYEPWAAINFGDSRYAPALVYQMPDPDAAKNAEENAANRTRLSEIVRGMREAGLDVTQADVDAIAKELKIAAAPRLGVAPTPAPAKLVRLKDRDNDGQFAPKGSGDQTGAPGSDNKGGSEGNGPKDDEDADEDEDEEPPADKSPLAKAELAQARLADAKERHATALERRNELRGKRAAARDAVANDLRDRVAVSERNAADAAQYAKEPHDRDDARALKAAAAKHETLRAATADADRAVAAGDYKAASHAYGKIEKAQRDVNYAVARHEVHAEYEALLDRGDPQAADALLDKTAARRWSANEDRPDFAELRELDVLAHDAERRVSDAERRILGREKEVARAEAKMTEEEKREYRRKYYEEHGE